MDVSDSVVSSFIIIDQFWGLVLKQVTMLVRKDYIWSRILERVIVGVPDRCMESVVVPLVKTLPW